MKNVLEWLEATVAKYPDKPAFSDTECSITFAQVYDIARNTGAYLIEQLGVDRTPVAVFAGRKMVTPAYFLGVVYAGRPYAPIDASLPDKRIEKILENLCPRAIVADRESLEHVENIVDELAKSEGFDRPQIFIAEDISRFGAAVHDSAPVRYGRLLRQQYRSVYAHQVRPPAQESPGDDLPSPPQRYRNR